MMWSSPPHTHTSHLQEAIDLDPRNPLARYERACVLANMNDVVAALAELEALKKVSAPS